MRDVECGSKLVSGVVIIVSLSSCLAVAGCESESDKVLRRARANEAELRQNVQRSIAPSWYVQRYTANSNPSPDGWNIPYHSPAHRSLLLLGLFVYPVLWIAISLRANLGSGESADNVVLGLFLVAGTYASIFILSWAVMLVSLLSVGLFTDEGFFIPWDFLSFSMHLTVMLGLLLWMISLLVKSAPPQVATSGVAVSPTTAVLAGSRSPSKLRRALVAAIKALVISTLSGIVSQLGGWIAGIIVMACGVGLAAVVHADTPPPPSQP